MEQIFRQTLLYDFYGELLTEHQRKVFEEVVLADLSYSEAAQELGVSRQGVHDLVRRCNSILEEYEDKLRLVERFLSIRRKAEQIRSLAGQEEFDASGRQSIRLLAEEILEEL